jgi:hypothetical protein
MASSSQSLHSNVWFANCRLSEHSPGLMLTSDGANCTATRFLFRPALIPCSQKYLDPRKVACLTGAPQADHSLFSVRRLRLSRSLHDLHPVIAVVPCHTEVDY